MTPKQVHKYAQPKADRGEREPRRPDRRPILIERAMKADRRAK